MKSEYATLPNIVTADTYLLDSWLLNISLLSNQCSPKASRLQSFQTFLPIWYEHVVKSLYVLVLLFLISTNRYHILVKGFMYDHFLKFCPGKDKMKNLDYKCDAQVVQKLWTTKNLYTLKLFWLNCLSFINYCDISIKCIWFIKKVATFS